MIDLQPEPASRSTSQRDQGFLQGFGIDVGDATAHRRRGRSAHRRPGRRPTAPRRAAGPRWRTCCQANPDINLVYTINEPAAAGAYRRSRRPARRTTCPDRLGRRRLPRRGERQGRRSSTRRRCSSRCKMASLGVEAVRVRQDRREARSRPRAWTSTTPVSTLITDEPVDGVESEDTTVGPGELLGLTATSAPVEWPYVHRRAPDDRPAGRPARDPDSRALEGLTWTTHRQERRTTIEPPAATGRRHVEHDAAAAHPARAARQPTLGPFIVLLLSVIMLLAIVRPASCSRSTCP